MPEYYGDLNDASDVSACNEPAAFTLESISIVFMETEVTNLAV